MADREQQKPPPLRVVRQGFVVGMLNPKALIFFVAVFPHFVDPSAGNVTGQLLVLGVIFTILAVLSDGTWGLIAGTARDWLSGEPHRLVTLRTVGGVVMLGLGVLIITTAIWS
jgi:threonine/homoserine/homoserine lactone efflux protein